MSLPEVITQHVEVATLELVPPMWGRPRIAALLAAFIDQIQALEDTAWEIIEQRELTEADLPRLKVLGKIVGQPRFGLTLEAYRLTIQARALANVSRGRASDILAVLNVLVGAGNYILLEVGDATLFLSITDVLTAEQVKTLRLVLPDVRSAGVGFQLLTSGSSDVFVWTDLWGPPEVWGSVSVI